MGSLAAAPAEDFQAAAVNGAFRRSGINSPSAPNAAALRAIAPIFLGSVTPSTATNKAGSLARAKISIGMVLQLTQFLDGWQFQSYSQSGAVQSREFLAPFSGQVLRSPLNVHRYQHRLQQLAL